jgi:DNA adenine methylase
MSRIDKMIAKPFLKWAGGKTQLINDIERSLPSEIINKKFTYIEPFVGSGAVLFWMINNFPKMQKAVINDINADLINAYRTIASKPKELISILEIFQNEFHELNSFAEKKKEYYYAKRDLYNTRNTDLSTQAALFIFLNRTCFNGLYRVNRKNHYNVPLGSYSKPTICDSKNILAVSEVLQKVEILCGDYQQTNDDEQIRLKDFCERLEKEGHKWMLSNSDVKGKNPNDNFFDRIYADFLISRVKAKRNINANHEICYSGIPLSGWTFRCNLLFVLHNSTFTSISNSKFAA